MRGWEQSKVPHVMWSAREAIRSLAKYHKIKDGKTVNQDKRPYMTDWHSSTYRMKPGDSLKIHCPPNGQLQSVYGSNPYTGSTSICSAAVHAGKITTMAGGTVSIKVGGPLKKAEGSQANGVKSNSTTYPGKKSYTIQ